MAEPSRRRLLVADDEPGIRALLGFLLEPEGWDTVAVPDGEEALARLVEGPFDLLLLDIHMPRRNGLQVLDGLRTMAARPPVIVMTSGSDPLAASRDWLQERGVAALLIKPFELDELLAAMDAVVGSDPRERPDLA